jgi:uncharacterized protein (DUF433 family)
MTKADYPSITKVEGVCGGKAIIRGTRITVRHIATLIQEGVSVDAILETYPHLTRSQVNDALRYYDDHRSEIDAEIKENRIENMLKKYGAAMDERGIVHFPGQGKVDGRGMA